mgnify:CR=1 FL=1
MSIQDIANGTSRQGFIYGVSHDELSAALGAPEVDVYAEYDDDGSPIEITNRTWSHVAADGTVATVYSYKFAGDLRIGGHDKKALKVIKGIFPHADIVSD